jgi:hypothetical protein
MRSVSLAATLLVLGGTAWAATGDTLLVTGTGVNVRAGPTQEARVILRVDRNQPVIEIAREGDWVRGEIVGAGGLEGWIHGSLLATPEGEQVAPPLAAAPPPPPEPEVAQPPPEPEPEVAEPPPPPAPAPEVAETPPDEPAEPEVAVTLPEVEEEPEALPEPAAGPVREIDLVGLDRFRENVDYLNSRAQAVAGVDLFTEVRPVGAGVVEVGTTNAWSTIPPAGQRSYVNTLLDRWVAATGADDPVSVRIVDAGGNVVMEQTGP